MSQEQLFYWYSELREAHKHNCMETAIMSQDLSMSSLTLCVEMVTPSSAFVTHRITDTQLIQGTYGVFSRLSITSYVEPIFTCHLLKRM